MAVDAVIIGTGLGGLVTGAKLAKEGKKILLLEQHSIPGGYATCFTQENFTIDVGLHSMDGLYERDPKIEIFEDLDVYFNVEFEKITTGYYRFTNSRIDFTIPDRREDAIRVLIEQFP
ncbi:MAG: NAD(P)-binding protein, partial [Candidatus Thorarchaeota archaeon]